MRNDIYPMWPYTLRASNRIKLAGMTGVCCAGAAILFLFNPASSGFYPPCPVNFLTGLYCPGCGTARALHQLLHGNLVGALEYNSLMVLTLPFLAYAFVSYASVALGGRSLPRLFNTRVWMWAIYGVILIYTILRNIPIYPFNLLAP